MSIAKLTVELPEGSVTRHYNSDDFISNSDLMGVEVESMVEVIINSKNHNF